MNTNEECICGKAGVTVDGYIFPYDEFMFVCGLCGSWYELEYDEVVDYFTEAEERNGE